MKNFTLLAIFFLAPAVFAGHTFNFFKLKNQLLAKNQSSQLSLASTNESNEDIDLSIAALLIPEHAALNNEAQLQINTMEIPWENIFKILMPILTGSGNTENWSKLNNLLNQKRQFNLGIENFMGLSWQKPLGYIDLRAFRDFKKLGDQVEITDTLMIGIKADSFIKHLQQKNLIEITKSNLNAFAGITFYKSFKSTHMANSLEEAHRESIESLLLPFKYFTLSGLEKLKRGSFIESHDSMSFNLGLEAELQAYSFLSANLKFSHQFQRITSLMLERPINEDQYRVSFQKMQEQSTSFQAGIGIDFYKLLGMTLFNFEYSKISSLKETNEYVITENERSILEHDLGENYKVTEVILESKHKIYEKIKSNSKISRGTILFWSRGSENENSQVKLVSKNEKSYYEHEYKSKFKKISPPFKGLLYFLVGMFSGAYDMGDKLYSMQDFEFAYDGSKNWDMKLSWTLQAKKWKGLFGKESKKKSKEHIKKYLSNSEKLLKQLEAKVLSTPLSSFTSIKITPKHLSYFLNLYNDQRTIAAANICGLDRSFEWWSLEIQQTSWKKAPRDKKRCYQKVTALMEALVNTPNYPNQVNFFKRLVKTMQDHETNLNGFKYTVGIDELDLEENFAAKQNQTDPEYLYQWKKSTTLAQRSVFDTMKALWETSTNQ